MFVGAFASLALVFVGLAMFSLPLALIVTGAAGFVVAVTVEIK